MGSIIQAKQAEMGKSKEKKTMQQLIKSMEGEIAKALPSSITPERFTRIVLSAISVNPKLAECTPKSFLAAMMQSAQLGLEVNTSLGQAYIMPYKNKGVLEAQFQLGYKGMIDLAYKADVKTIQAHTVYENDFFEYEYGLEPKLKHVPADGDRGEPVKVYALFRTQNDGFGFEVMSMEDVKKHAQKYSQSYSSSFSPWKTNFEEMAKKTVLKKALKYAPMKSEFVRAVSADSTVKTEIAPDMLDVQADTITEADYTEVNVNEDTGEVVDPDSKEG